MELRVIVSNGQIVLPASVRVPDGTEVRVVVDDDLLTKSTMLRGPFEPEPLDEADVTDDVRWATNGAPVARA